MPVDTVTLSNPGFLYGVEIGEGSMFFTGSAPSPGDEDTRSLYSFDVESLSDVSGVKRYNVYKNRIGYYGFAGSVEEPGIDSGNINTYREFCDDNISPDYTRSMKEIRNPFSDSDFSGMSPVCVSIMQQRLVVAGTRKESQTMWFSESGDLKSFGVHNPLIASDAITVTLDSRRMDPVRHLVNLKRGIVFTDGSEYLIYGGDSGAVSPMSIGIVPQSSWGCSEVPPLTIGTYVLFLQNGRQSVRDFAYRYTEDAYIGENITVLSDVLKSPVADWAYQRDPNGCVWSCGEDGSLCTLSYLREQEICAWARHESGDGRFLSACSIREGGSDRVYFMVRRGTGQNERIFVERLTLCDETTPADGSFYLDSAVLAVSDEPFTEITQTANIDLEHLYATGAPVVAYADNRVVKDVEIVLESDTYKVVLPFAARRVVIGIPYEMEITTVDPEITSEAGAVFGDKRSVAEISVSVQHTAHGLEAGPDKDHLLPVKLPMQEDWSGEPRLYSGTVSMPFVGQYRTEACVTLRHAEPTACMIRGVMAKVSVG